MIEERELSRLREIQPEIPQLARVVSHGRRIRRRRQLVRGFGGVVVAAGVVAAATFATAEGDDSVVEVAAPVDMVVPGAVDGDGRCGGFAEMRAPDQAGVPRLMPEWLPPGVEIEQAWARAEITEARTCPAVPVTLVAAAVGADGSVSAAVRLEGPSPEPYRSYSGPEYEKVFTRGDDSAHLVRMPAVDSAYRQLQWTEPEVGTSWSLTSYGLDDGELMAVAAALDLTGTSSSPVAQITRDVAGLKELWSVDGLPGDLPAEEPFWHVVVDDGSLLSIEVTRPLVPSPAAGVVVGPDARLITVRGATGILLKWADQSSITWDEADLRIQVSGSLALEDLLRVAESLNRVPADDPRITSP